MFNSIKADLIRVLRKKSFIIMAAIQILLFIFMIFVTKIGAEKDVELSGLYEMFIPVAVATIGIFNLVPIYLGVFKDNIKSNSLQTSIGYGISRTTIIFSKLIEVILLSAILLFVYSIIILAGAGILGVASKVAFSLIKDMWLGLVENLIIVVVVMMFVFPIQSTTFGLIVYIILSLGIADAVLIGINMIPFIAKLKIDFTKYTISGLFNSATGKEPIMWIPLLLIYVVLPLAITIFFFRKKELDI